MRTAFDLPQDFSIFSHSQQSLLTTPGSERALSLRKTRTNETSATLNIDGTSRARRVSTQMGKRMGTARRLQHDKIDALPHCDFLFQPYSPQLAFTKTYPQTEGPVLLSKNTEEPILFLSEASRRREGLEREGQASVAALAGKAGRLYPGLLIALASSRCSSAGLPRSANFFSAFTRKSAEGSFPTSL